MPIAVPNFGEKAELVIMPTSFPSALRRVAKAGGSEVENFSFTRRRLTWPRERTRSTISWPV